MCCAHCLGGYRGQAAPPQQTLSERGASACGVTVRASECDDGSLNSDSDSACACACWLIGCSQGGAAAAPSRRLSKAALE